MNTKIDLNTVIGIILVIGILIFFNYYNRPQPTSQPVEKELDSTSTVETEKVADEPMAQPVADTLKADGDSAQLQKNNRGIALAKFSENRRYTLENEFLRLEFSEAGGQLVKAELKDYRTYDSLPLYLIRDNVNFNLSLQKDEQLYTADLHFSGRQLNDSTVIMTLNTPEGGQLHYRYSLPRKGHLLNWQIESEQLNNYLRGQAGKLTWEMRTLRHEKNLDNERTMTAIEYRYDNDDDVDEFNDGGRDEEEIEDPLRWIAYKQQFFSSILWNQSGDLQNVRLLHDIDESEGFTKYLVSNSELSTTATGELQSDFGFYLGPNKYERLKAYDQDFDKLIPLGWGIFGWINRGLVINIFNWLDHYHLNYGLIILIIALIFKIILFPLTYQSYRSMAKMRVLKPEIDELNEKYKDKDPMKKQQATMELYQKAGVNPLGGCLPMLLQFPILIALFRFFPASIELRQESFLWADDLSTYDSVLSLPFTIPFYGDHVSLFTLLMTISTLIYTYMNQQLTGSAQNQQFPQMKYIIYLMPLVFLGVFNNYAAGLSYYYFVANVITFSQQFAIRSFLDEDKIHAKIQEKKKRPAKENRLMRRMKEMQEQQNRSTRRRK